MGAVTSGGTTVWVWSHNYMGMVTSVGNHSVGVVTCVWPHVWGATAWGVVTCMGVVTSVGSHSMGCGHMYGCGHKCGEPQHGRN